MRPVHDSGVAGLAESRSRDGFLLRDRIRWRSRSANWRTRLRDTRRYPQTLLFLVAYLIYNDAIQTVLAVAGQFGSDGLKMPISQLTTAILMAQFVGIFGAIGFGKLAARIGAKLAIATSLAIWAAILIYIYAFVLLGDRNSSW